MHLFYTSAVYLSDTMLFLHMTVVLMTSFKLEKEESHLTSKTVLGGEGI